MCVCGLLPRLHRLHGCLGSYHVLCGRCLADCGGGYWHRCRGQGEHGKTWLLLLVKTTEEDVSTAFPRGAEICNMRVINPTAADT